MLVSSLSVTLKPDETRPLGQLKKLAELAGSVCLLYSVSHQQLIQLARRGQPDQLGADFEASEEATLTLERRARGPTPDPGYHAPLKQGDGVKLGLEQGGGGLERCWCGSEPGGHLVPSSSAGQPSAPSRPPISWPPNSTCPCRTTLELSIDARTHTTHTTHIRSTLHYLHSIRFDLNG